jgi:hypothetical protein
MDTETARAVAGQRRRVTVRCIECRVEIKGATVRRRYCDRCREKLRKRRQRARAKG